MRDNRASRRSQGTTTIVEHDLQVHVFRVTEADLDNLFHSGTNMMVFLSVTIGLVGILATQAAIYLTGPSPWPYADNALPGVTFANIIGILWFGYQTIRSHKQRKTAYNRIKNPRN